MKNNLKHKLVGPRIKHSSGCFLRRIKSVITNELGGLVEHEYNLSQRGNCWIGKNAIAMGASRVCEDAVLNDFAVVKDGAVVGGTASLHEEAIVRDYSYVGGTTMIMGHTDVSNGARLIDAGVIRNNSFYFFISGFKFKITITQNNITIGCRTYSNRQFNNMCKSEAINLGCVPDEFETIQYLHKNAVKILKKRIKTSYKDI